MPGTRADNAPAAPLPGRQARRALAAACLVLCPLLPPETAYAADANTAPVVTIHIAGNKRFYRAGVPLEYQVVASDTEDGDSIAGTIDGHRVAVALDFVPAAPARFVAPAVNPDMLARLGPGRALVARRNCTMTIYFVGFLYGPRGRWSTGQNRPQ